MPKRGPHLHVCPPIQNVISVSGMSFQGDGRGGLIIRPLPQPREQTAHELLAEELASSMTDCGDYWHVPHEVGQRFVDAILHDRT